MTTIGILAIVVIGYLFAYSTTQKQAAPHVSHGASQGCATMAGLLFGAALLVMALLMAPLASG